MAAPLKTAENPSDIAAAMNAIGREAKAAARVLALAPAEQKNRALKAMAAAVRSGKSEILSANAEDMKDGKANPTDPTYTGLDVCTPDTADTCIGK